MPLYPPLVAPVTPDVWTCSQKSPPPYPAHVSIFLIGYLYSPHLEHLTYVSGALCAFPSIALRLSALQTSCCC